MIDTIHVTKEHIFTGGRDQIVNVLDPVTLGTKFKVDLGKMTELNSLAAKPRALSVDPTGKFVTVGTFGCEIYYFVLNS